MPLLRSLFNRTVDAFDPRLSDASGQTYSSTDMATEGTESPLARLFDPFSKSAPDGTPSDAISGDTDQNIVIAPDGLPYVPAEVANVEPDVYETPARVANDVFDFRRRSDESAGGEMQTVTVNIGRDERDVLVYTPVGYDPSQTYEAIVVYHGSGSWPDQISKITGFTEYADDNGFIVAFPDAKGISWKYDSGFGWGTSDVDFAEPIVTELTSGFSIDPDNIYAAGISAGGILVQNIALSDPGLFAGYASVAANVPDTFPVFLDAEEPVKMLLFHGTADPVSPFLGGVLDGLRLFGSTVLSANETAEIWSSAAGQTFADFELLPDLVQDGTTVLRRMTPDGTVQQYVVEGGGHNWPGQDPGVLGNLGTITEDIDATETIIDFFGL